jgi:hypothetical protein
MANLVYNRGKTRLGTGATVWTTSTIKALLLKSTATPNADDNFVADAISGSLEISTTGYARVTMTSPTATEDDTNDRLSLDCADVAFGAVGDSSQTAGWLVFYHEVTNDADSPLLFALDLADTVLNGSAFTVTISADGAITLT